MAQGVKGRDIDADAHELVDVLGLDQLVHPDVFLRIALLLYFPVGEKFHVLGGIKGKALPLIIVDGPQDLQVPGPAPPALRRLLRLSHLREELSQDVFIAVLLPAAFRLCPQLQDIVSGGRQDTSGVESAVGPRGLQDLRRKALPVFFHQPQVHLLSGKAGLLQKCLVPEGAAKFFI